MTEPGFIYALINPSLEGLVKVGSTTRDPETRASELSSATGIPTPFIVAYSIRVNDTISAEAYVHTSLEKKGFRTAANREFFHAQLSEIIECMLQARSLETTEGYDAEELATQTDSPAASVADPANEVYEMAEDYLYGLGDCLQDYDEALQLFKKAAKMGHPKAFLKIGIMYAYGEGCLEDIDKALGWFKAGVKHSDPDCYAEMAKIYHQSGQEDNARKCWNKYFLSGAFGDNRNSAVGYAYSYISENFWRGLHQLGFKKAMRRYLPDLEDYAVKCLSDSDNWYLEGSLRAVRRLRGCRGRNEHIHQAIELHNGKMLDKLIASGVDVNSRNKNNNTPLHMAAKLGFEDMTRILLAAGANPDCDNDDLDTPLTISAYRQHVSVCEALLNGGANPNIRGRFGASPLHCAVAIYSTDIIRLLIAAGADINIEDGFGATCLKTLKSEEKDDDKWMYAELRSALIEELEGYGAI